MDPVSLLPAIICVLVAVATASLLARQFGVPQSQGRYASIDGLRGYLAFFVFLHHASIWYFLLRTGQWKAPPSNLYNHFGLGSVALFFMITGFLFFSKLLDGRAGNIDWGKLFISRFLRLTPLYLFVMLLLFMVVASLSGGTLNEPVPKLMEGIISWLGFAIPGMPSLNGVQLTSYVVARVTWSLPYEWLFYFALPLLALVVGVVPPVPYIVLGIASIAGMMMWGFEVHYLILMAFLGGIMASFFVRWDRFRQIASGKMASLVAVACITAAVAIDPSPFGYVPMLLLSVAFTIIACGNNLFGVLVSAASRTLGEMSYSIYLLHGITLFVTFVFVLGAQTSREMSTLTHWLLIAAITPVLLCVSFVTFRLIENPAMRSVTPFMAWLRRQRLNRN